MDDGAEVGFRLPDQTSKDSPGVQLQQWHTEHLGCGFGGQCFSGSWDADDEQALGSWQSVFDGFLSEGISPFQQPFLQHIQTANGFQAFFGFDEFQESVLLHGLGFLPGDNYRDRCSWILTTDRAKAFSASMVVSPEAASTTFSLCSSSMDLIPADSMMPPNTVRSSCFPWQREFNDGQFSFKFRGQAQTTAQDDEGLVLGLGPLENVLELADEDGIGVLEEQVEVPQQDNRLLFKILDGD